MSLLFINIEEVKTMPNLTHCHECDRPFVREGTNDLLCKDCTEEIVKIIEEDWKTVEKFANEEMSSNENM
ncbi:MAG: hypothetical protein H8E55_08165 [Pelagibacterales bacterium]|nr:hypothetical protein [Pelagibacterales bacterium]